LTRAVEPCEYHKGCAPQAGKAPPLKEAGYIRYNRAMVRFRRIEDRDRIFFVTTNVARGIRDFSPAERDTILDVLAAQRARVRSCSSVTP